VSKVDNFQPAGRVSKVEGGGVGVGLTGGTGVTVVLLLFVQPANIDNEMSKE
jgi:anaerobic C4-dicarboxylate transporter